MLAALRAVFVRAEEVSPRREMLSAAWGEPWPCRESLRRLGRARRLAPVPAASFHCRVSRSAGAVHLLHRRRDILPPLEFHSDVVEQFSGTYAEGAGDAEDQRQLRHVVPPLDEADLKRGDSGGLGEPLLGPPFRVPALADCFTEGDRLRCLLCSRRHVVEHCHGKD